MNVDRNNWFIKRKDMQPYHNERLYLLKERVFTDVSMKNTETWD